MSGRAAGTSMLSGRSGARRPVAAWGAGAALACLLMLAACGRSESTAPTPAPPAQERPDACALVTRAEVEAALGMPAGEPEQRLTPSGRGSSCLFGLTTPGGRRTLQVQVEAPPRGRLFTAADIRSFAATAAQGQPTAVAGVGEAAYLSNSTLHVLKHNRHLSVGDPQFTGTAEPFDPEALKKLAQTASERLPR